MVFSVKVVSMKEVALLGISSLRSEVPLKSLYFLIPLSLSLEAVQDKVTEEKVLPVEESTGVVGRVLSDSSER